MAIDGGDPGDGRMPDHPTTAETSRRLASAAGRLSRALCSMAALSAADGAGPAYAQPARRAAPVRAVLSVPVRLDGTVIGALDFYRRRPGTWTGGQIALGEHLADTAADLVARLAAHPEAHDHGRP